MLAPSSCSYGPGRTVWIVRIALLIFALIGDAASAASPGCRLSKRVIGGSVAEIAHWPSFATIRLFHVDNRVSLHFCGGAVIGSEWVVTAAHCLDDLEGLWRALVSETDDFSRVELEVVVGVANLDSFKPDAIHRVRKAFQHEVYAAKRKEALAGSNPDQATRVAQSDGHDIALIQLARPWHGPLSRISLQSKTDPRLSLSSDETVLVAGFGSTEPGSGDTKSFTRSNGERYFASSAELLEVTLPLVNIKKCRAAWPNSAIGSGQYCAGFDKGKGKDSCNGDSGGPLIVLDQDLCPVQIGLVSWGPSPCAPLKQAYGVYTRLSYHAPWLRRHVGKLSTINAKDR